MDVRMPVMGGYEAAAADPRGFADRPDARTVPIIAMTALTPLRTTCSGVWTPA
jgi:CheY-like chemotaxis protein